jgi:hypothetical protein
LLGDDLPAPALLRYFGETPLDQIKPEHVEQFKLWRIKQKKSAPARKAKKLGAAVKTDKALKPELKETGLFERPSVSPNVLEKAAEVNFFIGEVDCCVRHRNINT